MANAKIVDLREKFPPDIIKWANLETTANNLLDNFETGHKKNAELINRFFEQPYFRWEESLINKFSEIKPDIKFDDIKNEWINLALLYYKDHLYDLNSCLNKVKNVHIKQAFIQKIFNEIQTKIWWQSLYTDFSNECKVPLTTWTPNVLAYFQKVIKYLEEKQITQNWKKVFEILKDINITNEYLNSILPVWEQIPTWVNLSDPSIPENTKNDFDTLLSFEIWKEADRTIGIAKDLSNNLQKLATNSLPAINTVIWESDKYRYDENKLWDEYQWKLQKIKDDTNLSDTEKDEQINDLRRDYYIKYLKTKNSKIWKAIEQLYNNDFDYSKVEPQVLKDYFDRVADIRLSMLFNKSTDSGKSMNEFIRINWGNLDEFKKFYKQLTNVDPNNPTLNITLSDVNIPWSTPPTTWSINIPIQRKVIEKKNCWLKNIDQFWKNAEKAFDAFPMEFTIKKSDINSLNIAIEDKVKLLNFLSKYDQWDKYEIKWENIWTLIYLFFIINKRSPITELNTDEQKEIETLFWQAKNHEDLPENTNTEKKEWEISNIEKFKKNIEKYWPGKFENWSEIWLPMANSELPGWWYQWMKIKLSKVNMKKWTFSWTTYGWELKFNNKFEWKTYEFEMDENFFDMLKEISKDPNKIWLQPNPDKSDFDSFKNKLNNKLWTKSLAFPIPWVEWNGNKFTQKISDEKWKEKEVEVKYFWSPSDNKTIYKIEYNPYKKSFTVSSRFNWDEKWKDWKSTKKRFYYERDMDWNNFLIFFTQKWLAPQTEEQATDRFTMQDQEFKVVNGGHWKLNRFSLSNLKNVFKTVTWNIKKKVDDYNKAQDQKLEDIIIWDWWIYGGLAKVLGFIPSVKAGLWELQQEYYNDRDNRTWKKIEKYLKIYQADPDFWTTFEQIPPHAKIQWWKSLQKIVLNRVKNAKDRMWDPGIYQAAALLLANFEKWWSPYRWLANQENSGLWVKALLWNAHYKQFMRDKARLIAARDNAENWGSWDKKWLNETLAACEMKYIINNVRWSYKWLIEWSYEDRWIPWEENTDYIDNPSKRLLSDQFANKLDAAYKWRFNKGTVEEKYGKFKSNNSFDEMENEFWKASSTRYQIWEAALRRMIDLASNDNLRNRMKKCFLAYLLSGALDVNCDPGLKKQVYEYAKPMMFVPGLLVKEAWVAENIATLLDDATKWDFSKNVTKYFHRSQQLKGSPDLKWLKSEINAWLTDEKMKDLDDYFSKLPTMDFTWHAKGPILKKFRDAMSDSSRDEADRRILENPKVVSNWLLSSVEVAQKRMSINKRWEFDGKDIDETNNMKDFRKRVTEDIEWRALDERNVAFVLDKFFKRFSLDSQQIYEWIVTADFWNKKRWPFQLPHKGISLNMWNIWEKEINSILWYTFEWNAWKSRWLGCDRLPDELFNTLEAFRKYFSKAFYSPNWNLLLSNHVIDKAFNQPRETSPLLIGSRDVYDQAFAWDSEFQFMDSSINDDDLFSGDKDKARKAKKNETKRLLKWDDFINSDIVNIEKQLKKNLGWTSKQFPTVTSSQSRTSRELYLRNRLAA